MKENITGKTAMNFENGTDWEKLRNTPPPLPTLTHNQQVQAFGKMQS